MKTGTFDCSSRYSFWVAVFAVSCPDWWESAVVAGGHTDEEVAFTRAPPDSAPP